MSKNISNRDSAQLHTAQINFRQSIFQLSWLLLLLFLSTPAHSRSLPRLGAKLPLREPSQITAAVQTGAVYKLRNQCSNKVLNVAGVSQLDGAVVQQWADVNGLNQHWKLEATDAGYFRLLAQHSQKALDAHNGGTSDGTQIVQWQAHNNANQQWKITDVGNGFYKLAPRHAPDKVLSVVKKSKLSGALIRLYSDYGTCAQKWQLEPISATAPRLVFAHYMVAIRSYGSSVEGYKRDIREAQAGGLDGFALNAAGWSVANYKIDTQRIFQAAQELNTNFKLFFSADMCCGLPASDIQDMMRTYASHPNYYHYQNRPLLSTYGGEGQDGGGINARNWWQTNVLQPLRSENINLYFVPAFSTSDYNSYEYDKVLNGYNLWWKDVVDGMFWFGAAGIPDYRNDNFSLLRGGENYARVMHDNNRPYMATVSPQYWGALQDGIGRRYFEFRGGEGLEAQWQSIVTVQKPEWVEMVTWNDFTESTYFSPIYDVYDYWPYTSIAAKGFFKSHAGALELNKYFIGWYKTGTRPAIAKDQLYWFYRTHPKDLTAANDPRGAVNWRIGDVQDEIFVTTLLTAPAELRVITGGVTKTYAVAAGMQHTRIGFNTGAQTFELWRSGQRLVQKSGDPFENSIALYNFNYTTGAVVAP